MPDGETVETWLRKECERGLVERYGAVTPALRQRLDYELGVIISMGYAGYFLIVADFVRFAREQRIQTTCRGSAPGSIEGFAIDSRPHEQAIGQPMRQAVGADPVRCRLDIIRRTAIGDLARNRIEHRERGRRIAVARLPDRAEHGEPAPAAEQLHRHV